MADWSFYVGVITLLVLLLIPILDQLTELTKSYN
jgi:hypothetical protein